MYTCMYTYTCTYTPQVAAMAPAVEGRDVAGLQLRRLEILICHITLHNNIRLHVYR